MSISGVYVKRAPLIKKKKMFSNNKFKLRKVAQQNMTEGIQRILLLSSKFYENNIFFRLRQLRY